jgi:hypothetical protein
MMDAIYLNQRIIREKGAEYGLLLFAILVVFPTHRDGRLLSRALVSGQQCTSLGGLGDGHLCAKGFDTYIHLSEHGLQQHLVRRTLDRRDPGVFRRQP